jgi:hypothetical protein
MLCFIVISTYKFTITFFVVHISELELSLIYVRRPKRREDFCALSKNSQLYSTTYEFG